MEGLRLKFKGGHAEMSTHAQIGVFLTKARPFLIVAGIIVLGIILGYLFGYVLGGTRILVG
ncbi:MAG: hypothetical protein ACTSRW_03140 [Candidatus Helarchaeota archaeon]